MNAPNRTLGIALVVALFGCSLTHADTFTTPLHFSVQSGAYGQYLSADFDFHAAFSRIDSVTLDFAMPGGYTALAGGTQENIVFGELSIVATDGVAWPNFGSFLSADRLAGTATDIPAGSQAHIDLIPVLTLVNEDTFVPVWPDFVKAGAGSIGLTSLVVGSWMFGGEQYTSWSLPGEIANPQLTIVGAAVPEPSSAALIVSGALLVVILHWTTSRGFMWRRFRASLHHSAQT